MADWAFPYWPTDRQKEAHRSAAEELLFGGAAGGGKSFYLLGLLVMVCILVPGVQVLALRRTFPDLKRSLISKLLPLIPAQVARYNQSDHAWIFRNGSRLEMGYLQTDKDVYQYQGAEYAVIAFDELTQFTEFQYKYMLSRVRAGGKVLARMRRLGLVPCMRATANPGGIGHHWVKARFIDPAVPGKTWQPKPSEDEPHPLTRCYIKSLLTDNPYLDQEQYRRQLQAMDPVLRRALLNGDWDIIEGVRFSQWRADVHVIDPSQLPISALHGPKCVAVDYGFSAPFAALWLCKLHDGLVVVYREEYATELTATQQAQLITSRETEHEVGLGRHRAVVMDPAMWRRNDAVAHKSLDPNLPPVGSPAHDYQKVLGQVPVKAVNARVHGWSLLDEKLRVRGDGLPRLLVYNTCRDLIRTLPSLPRDKKDVEDVDTKAEDHLADALRYGLMFLEGKTPNNTTPRRPEAEPKPLTAVLSSAKF